MFTPDMIAPCGLDCSICSQAQKAENPCPGCNGPDENKPDFCAHRCGIILCQKRKDNGWIFCDVCPDFPCADVMEKEDRYTSAYPLRESPLENLRMIREEGLDAFLELERKTWTCADCGGTGVNRKNVKIKVDIPAGVDTDSIVTVRGQGEPGVNGGPDGDLYIVVNVRPHSTYKRRGDDLYLDLPITFDVAALGGKVQVPGFGETYSYTITPGTQTGSSFRLRGKGVPNVRTRRKGDLYVKVVVEVPSKLSRKEKKAIEEMAKQLGNDAYPKKQRFEKLKF